MERSGNFWSRRIKEDIILSVAIYAEMNVAVKEEEKLGKYGDLVREIGKPG